MEDQHADWPGQPTAQVIGIAAIRGGATGLEVHRADQGNDDIACNELVFHAMSPVKPGTAWQHAA